MTDATDAWLVGQVGRVRQVRIDLGVHARDLIREMQFLVERPPPAPPAPPALPAARPIASGNLIALTLDMLAAFKRLRTLQ